MKKSTGSSAFNIIIFIIVMIIIVGIFNQILNIGTVIDKKTDNTTAVTTANSTTTPTTTNTPTTTTTQNTTDTPTTTTSPVTTSIFETIAIPETAINKNSESLTWTFLSQSMAGDGSQLSYGFITELEPSTNYKIVYQIQFGSYMYNFLGNKIQYRINPNTGELIQMGTNYNGNGIIDFTTDSTGSFEFYMTVNYDTAFTGTQEQIAYNEALALTIRNSNNVELYIIKVDDIPETPTELIATAFNGEGTITSPYVITSAENLKYLQEQVSAGNNYEGKYISLANDINLGNYEWTPIGGANPFSGVFDGKGFTVSGLSITNYALYNGLFGCVKSTLTNTAIIANLTVDGSIVLDEADTFGGHPRIGGIVGETLGNTSDRMVTLINCVSKVDVTINKPTTAVSHNIYVGGSIGMGKISQLYNCVNEGNFNINYGGDSNGGEYNILRIGGIVGFNQSCTYTNCTNNGDIVAVQSIPQRKLEYIGGILGSCGTTMSSINTEFLNCVNNGDISSENKLDLMSRSSGIIGGFYGNTATIDNCYNTGIITSKITATEATSTAYAGGIIAYLYNIGGTTNVTIKNSYNSGTITAIGGYAQVTGGIAGLMNTEAGATNTIENCATTTDTIIGTGTGTVTNSTSSISLSDFNTLIIPIDTAITNGISYDFNTDVNNLSIAPIVIPTYITKNSELLNWTFISKPLVDNTTQIAYGFTVTLKPNTTYLLNMNYPITAGMELEQYYENSDSNSIYRINSGSSVTEIQRTLSNGQYTDELTFTTDSTGHFEYYMFYNVTDSFSATQEQINYHKALSQNILNISDITISISESFG